MLATPELVLQLGDKLTVVGEANAILNVEKVPGNKVLSLKEPNLVAVFIGIVLDCFWVPYLLSYRESVTL